MHDLREERTLGQLFGQLSEDVGLLVRQEAQLAKTEMQQKLSRSIADLVSLAAGGIVVMIGALAVTTAIVLLLVHPVGLDPWLAALLVGGVLAVTGLVMVRGGLRSLKKVDPAPRRTMENIKEDIQMMKERRP
jgi:Putative Actinobacterial Holin-X, holin superfamily III